MSLKRDLASGVFYTAIAKYAGMAVTLVVTAILARHFTPHEFGIVNIATVFIAFFNIFCDLGFGPAVIQKDLDEDDLGSIFRVSFVVGAIFSIIFFFAADIISIFYDNDWVLKVLLKLLSVSLFFSAVNMVPNALILKAKRFGFIAYRTLAVQVICGAAAVGAAYWGLGIYSLVISPIASAVIMFLINYFQHPLSPLGKVKKESIDKIKSYSSFQFAFQVLLYFNRNLDKLLMGKYMSMSELGYYDKSYRLMMMPLQNLSFVISPVLHPIFAQIKEDREKITDAYIKILHFLAIIGFPLSIAMYFMARNLVMVFFGSQWAPSIPSFQILALSIGFQMLTSTSGSIFQASNATDKMFISGVFGSICSLSAILIGVLCYGTTEGVAILMDISFVLTFLQCFYMLFYRTLRLGWLDFWKALNKPAVISAVMFAVLWLSRRFVIDAYLSDLTHMAQLICYMAISGITWLVCVFVWGDELITGLLKEMAEKAKKHLHLGA